MDKLFSYCQKCLCAQYYTLVNGHWVCEECGKPLQTATIKCTNATPRIIGIGTSDWEENFGGYHGENMS